MVENSARDQRTSSKQPLRHEFLQACYSAVVCYCLTSWVVVFGVMLGAGFVEPGPLLRLEEDDFMSRFAMSDGQWYKSIVENGYAYHPTKRSNVAFFPAYPLLAAGLKHLTGCRTELALLLVANICFFASLVLLYLYVGCRFPNGPANLAEFAMYSLALWPNAFFFRMAYSESLFLFLTILALFGMARQWRIGAIAAIVGLATATRPVGVGLIVPLVLHLAERAPTVWGFARTFLWAVPVCCWGLLAYVGFQWWYFEDPWVFTRTQAFWRERPPVEWWERVIDLACLEPIRSVFDPSSPCYWDRAWEGNNPVFNGRVVNVCFFLLACVAVLAGMWRGKLTTKETALAWMLLLIPYATRGHEMCLASASRFAAVVFPVNLLLGIFFARFPLGVSLGLMGVSGFLMGAYAAMFAAGRGFF